MLQLCALLSARVLRALPRSFAQMEAQSPSYTALDRRVSSLFFSWGVFNVFLGAMLVRMRQACFILCVFFVPFLLILLPRCQHQRLTDNQSQYSRQPVAMGHARKSGGLCYHGARSKEVTLLLLQLCCLQCSWLACSLRLN